MLKKPHPDVEELVNGSGSEERFKEKLFLLIKGFANMSCDGSLNAQLEHSYIDALGQLALEKCSTNEAIGKIDLDGIFAILEEIFSMQFFDSNKPFKGYCDFLNFLKEDAVHPKNGYFDVSKCEWHRRAKKKVNTKYCKMVLRK